MGFPDNDPSAEMFTVASLAFYHSIRTSPLSDKTQDNVLKAFSSHISGLVTSKRTQDKQPAAELAHPVYIPLNVPLLCKVIKLSARYINQDIGINGNDYAIAAGKEAIAMEAIQIAAENADSALNRLTLSFGRTR